MNLYERLLTEERLLDEEMMRAEASAYRDDLCAMFAVDRDRLLRMQGRIEQTRYRAMHAQSEHERMKQTMRYFKLIERSDERRRMYRVNEESVAMNARDA